MEHTSSSLSSATSNSSVPIAEGLSPQQKIDEYMRFTKGLPEHQRQVFLDSAAPFARNNNLTLDYSHQPQQEHRQLQV
jgi:hypothetical protein